MKKALHFASAIAVFAVAALRLPAATPITTANDPAPQEGATGASRSPGATDGEFAEALKAAEWFVNGSPSVVSGAADGKAGATPEQRWNFHAQSTVIFQGDLPFPAKYSGPHSLDAGGENRETVSVDLMAGFRLWQGAEVHVDGLFWQGFGLSNTLGVAGVNNGEAFKVGTYEGNLNFARLFIRQTFGLGGEQEDVPDDPLHLAGKQDISRITLTIGRFSAKDIFDPSAYANDPRMQFMNWALLANAAWDFPADSLGFTSGGVIELNQKYWTLRYGFFQVPKEQNGDALDLNVFNGWHMVTEFERRFSILSHPGAVRLLGFLTQTHAGEYEAALDDPVRPAVAPHDGYTRKYGFGLNVEQEIVKDVGAFARLGWNNGKTEDWQFTDADHAASCGFSVKGSFWKRPDDTLGIAEAFNGISTIHREFLNAGGLGLDTGDGGLTYGVEKIFETYYDVHLWKRVHVAFDYQFVSDPAYNRDRGPVDVFSGRIHWEF